MAQNTLFMQGRQLPAGSGSSPGATVKDIINIPKIWAAVNRKNAAVTDTKGYLNTYICKVEVVSTDVLSYLYTAPENWVLKNGVRKWHIARNEQRAAMFGDRAGQTTYGKTIRPLLHSGHQTSDNAADYYELPGVRRGAAVTGGDWTYTQMAHAPGVLIDTSSASVNFLEIADEYELCLAGNTQLTTGETGHDDTKANRYSHVSIMESYLLSRRNFEGGSGGEGSDDSDITPTPSPLVEFMGNSSSSVEVARIMDEEMEFQPPYALQDASGNIPADATDLYYAGALRTTETYGRDSAIIRVPGGLLELHSSTQVGSSGSAPARLPFWNIEVLGVTRAEG
jgi:hypothetical protein